MLRVNGERPLKMANKTYLRPQRRDGYWLGIAVTAVCFGVLAYIFVSMVFHGG